MMRASTLKSELARHFIVVVSASLALLVLLAAVVYTQAQRNAQRQAIGIATQYYTSRFRELDQSWLNLADALRRQIEFGRFMEDNRFHALLTSFLASFGGEFVFSHVTITDNKDAIVFQSKTRSTANLPLPPQGSEHGWIYSDIDHTIYRSFAMPLWGKGGKNYRLYLYTPLDQGLLNSISYPHTLLTLIWDHIPVTGKPASGTVVQQFMLDDKGPEVIVSGDFSPPLTLNEIIVIILAGGSLILILGTYVLNRWANDLRLRLNRLIRECMQFPISRQVGRIPPDADDSERRHKNDEVQQLKKSLFELMESVVHADARADTSHERLELIFDSVSEGILLQDCGGNLISCNAAAERILGLPAQDIAINARNPHLHFIDEHGLPIHPERLSTLLCLSTCEPVKNVVLGLPKSGATVTWLSIDSQPLNDKTGKPFQLVFNFSDITSIKHSEEMIVKQANYDFLTELPNRRLFYDRLSLALAKARRGKETIAVLFLDLDHFKEVNDTLGHHTGDDLLIEVAERIKTCLRMSDTIARLGGDEFTIFVEHVHDLRNIDTLAQSIIEVMTRPFDLHGRRLFVTASIGVTIFPQDADTVDGLLRNADQAMYEAKSLGRNQLCYFTPEMQHAAQRRMKLGSDLHEALRREQIEIHYQPIVHLDSGFMSKAEALLRWWHPQHGPISPVEFIPLTESNGSISNVGDWVFQNVLRQLGLWHAENYPHMQISINVSPVQLRTNPQLIEEWLAKMREHKIEAANVVLEITEGVLMDASAEVMNMLDAFRSHGGQISIDDFGTGYSSLSYLKKFRVDYLKIDQSFVRNLSPFSEDMTLCEAIIAMSHKLGIRVIAEGIETAEQCLLLAQMGCDFGQGFYFSRPVAAKEFAEWANLQNISMQSRK